MRNKKGRFLKGHKNTPEGLSKMVLSHLGKKRSEETKIKISLGNIGKHLGKKYPKDLFPNFGNRGKLQTKESNDKRRNKEKGIKKGPMSEKTKEKLSFVHRGKRKDKKYEELYGIEKAKEIKLKQSLSKIGNKNPMKYLDTRKKVSATKQGISLGEWKKFIGKNPYPSTFTKTFKLAIKQRDGFMCLKCGMRDEDCLILFKRKLTIHHIDSLKENTFKENCCALCLRCNNEVQKDREIWKKHFHALLSERDGYQYSEDGIPILNIEVKI